MYFYSSCAMAQYRLVFVPFRIITFSFVNVKRKPIYVFVTNAQNNFVTVL